jgi:hypothetical protein
MFIVFISNFSVGTQILTDKDLSVRTNLNLLIGVALTCVMLVLVGSLPVISTLQKCDNTLQINIDWNFPAQYICRDCFLDVRGFLPMFELVL